MGKHKNPKKLNKKGNYKAKTKKRDKDFEKKVVKLGKKKLKPANHTQIKFKAQKIYVSEQKFNEISNNNNININKINNELNECLSHLNNHSCKTRKNVLINLKQILSKVNNNKIFNIILSHNLVNIINIFELIYDNDKLVRHQLRLFINWFIIKCQYNIELFRAFFNIILCHLSVGLSNIDTNIRFNSIKILRSFFMIDNYINFFDYKGCLILLKHIQLLFYDIIKIGNFGLNQFDNKNDGNIDDKKIKKKKDKKNEMIGLIHILCECCTHMLRVINKVCVCCLYIFVSEYNYIDGCLFVYE